MSNSAAQLRGKIPGQIPMMHTVRGGLRALPATFGIFRGVDGGGVSQIPAQGFLYFCGRDVGAVTPAASLTKIECRDVGRDIIRCDRGLRAWDVAGVTL